MANEDFIFRLGADISKFSKSITEVEAELKGMKNVLKTQTGQALVETNRYIAELEQTLINLRKVGLDKLPQSAYAGAAALNSISQVARDLPFGFIAIQNNLPIVLDQFSQLSKTSGGLGGALKAIGTSLIGPAGLSFAFGAIIAGVTSLTQKYGSLGEAFRNVFGLVTEAEKLQKSYNKELLDGASNSVEESNKINILISTLNDSKKPYSERIAAYRELKKETPDVVAGIKDENALTKESITLINEQAKQRKNLILLKAQEQALNKVISEVTNKQLSLEIERAGLINNFTQAQEAYNRAKKQGTIAAAQAEGFQAVEVITLNDAEAALKNNITAYNQTISTTDEYLKKLEPLINSISQYNSKVYDSEEALKAYRQAQKDALKSTKDFYEEQKKLVEFEVPMASPSGGVQFDNFLKRLKEQAKIQKELKQQQLDLENQKATKGFLTDTIAGFKDVKIPKIEDVIFDKERMDKVSSEYQKLMQQRFNNIKGIVENTLTAPLTYLFDTVLEGGKISWKELGNIIIDQLKRIAVQVATTAAAVAVADLITGGKYSESVKLFNKASSLVDGGTGFGRSRTSAVNFGGLQGGLGLSGQVVFVQRGSDLVGVINRANATINRVG